MGNNAYINIVISTWIFTLPKIIIILKRGRWEITEVGDKKRAKFSSCNN